MIDYYKHSNVFLCINSLNDEKKRITVYIGLAVKLY